MSFDHPWLLLLLILPVAVALGWPGAGGGGGLGRRLWPAFPSGFLRPGRWRPGRRHVSPERPPRPRLGRWRPGRLLRALALACLILALAGPTLPLPARGLAVAVVVDRSASMEPALDQVTAAVNHLLAASAGSGLGGHGVQVAVISAGAAADVERSPAPLPQPPLAPWSTPARREATDLAAALRLAAGTLPPDHRRRVVLISDGRATQGDAVAEARALAAAGIVLDTVVISPQPGPDLAVTGVKAPATARPNRPVAVEVTVRASQPGPARLHLLAGDEAVASQAVQLAAGENRFILTTTPRRPGTWALRAVVEPVAPAVDGEPANNSYDALVEVEGTRPVLVLSPEPDSALARALRAQGIPVESRTPAQRPADLAGWSRYGAVVLENVPAHQLGEGAMADLERFVRDLGGGLVMAGLPDTFGPGGYTGTPVERALPVDTDLRSRKNLPTVALALVIDRSGSMEGVKLEMAVEAARRVAQLLTPADRLGVILFDTQAYVTRPMVPVDGAGQVEAAFPSAAGGGTSLGVGLEAALHLMKDVRADVRHVIALTDGVSEPFDVAGTARAFHEQGITVSAVAIGADADTTTLGWLAQEGGGQLYVAADPGQIPSLITRDTALATRQFIVDRPFLPVVTASPAPGGPGALLQGLEAPAGPGAAGRLPPLGGYVATTPKDRGEVLLASDEGDPVLAAWFYGLGRAVAWTAPTAGEGVAAWLGNPNRFARLWANVADWLLEERGGAEAPWRVEARATAPGTVTVTVQGSPPLAGRVRVGQATAPLLPVAAGRSEAVVPVAEPGIYPVIVEPAPPFAQEEPADREGGVGAPSGPEDGAGDETGRRAAASDGTVALRTTVAVPYPAEFLLAGADPALLQALAAVTGGKAMGLEEFDPAEVLDPAGVPAPPGRRPLWPYLLLAAALLLPADVAARRLGWEWRRGTTVPGMAGRVIGGVRAVLGHLPGGALRRRPQPYPNANPAPDAAGDGGSGSERIPGAGAGWKIRPATPSPGPASPTGGARPAGGAEAVEGGAATSSPAGDPRLATGGGSTTAIRPAAGASPVVGARPGTGARSETRDHRPQTGPVPQPAHQDADLVRLYAARQRSRVRAAQRVRRHVDPPPGSPS